MARECLPSGSASYLIRGRLTGGVGVGVRVGFGFGLGLGLGLGLGFALVAERRGERDVVGVLVGARERAVLREGVAW